jgi:hypothetical protein
VALLHLYASDDPNILLTADRRGASNRFPVAGVDDLILTLDGLVRNARRFDRILFETHGGPGYINFRGQSIDADWWREAQGRNWGNLTTANARVYFNGCRVAAGSDGWAFLGAVAAILLNPGGGEVFGQTSRGFGNLFTGHVVHLWGQTRKVIVGPNGRILRRVEE